MMAAAMLDGRNNKLFLQENEPLILQGKGKRNLKSPLYF
jgi:hypothetical protein